MARMVAHPAKFSQPILDVLIKNVSNGLVLDPMAGVDKRTICGDALNLPFVDATFDSIVVSPVYGSRMSDSHVAKDTSRRHTYTHTLGRQLHENNSGKLQWGPAYREFHVAAWRESSRVLKPDGQFWLNISDHIRRGEVQPVSDWHLYALEFLGFKLKRKFKVQTKRLRHGENHEKRVGFENIFLFQRSL